MGIVYPKIYYDKYYDHIKLWITDSNYKFDPVWKEIVHIKLNQLKILMIRVQEIVVWKGIWLQDITCIMIFWIKITNIKFSFIFLYWESVSVLVMHIWYLHD